ncbi:MAG: 2-amino-4-hydroxy-6-hydroxymethyldihydropteridine diphosphokinase [Clostridiales bacterium GWB2_37_7]|nr:MAG: 2-amino-4-hydroxy-6-hydroxymethyldihydropteridine diphosphokinase [Clostridiales bacterium GWB2_37_7]
MPRAYLGLGGNIGRVKENIEEGLRLLRDSENVQVLATSSYYKTAPVGFVQQDWFLNIAAEIETALSPYELLALCNDIEQQLKRERLIKWGPRTIDIDILLYEGFESNSNKLTVPHPRMTERAFVMIPLQEIAPELIIKGQHIKDITSNLDNQEIRKLTDD